MADLTQLKKQRKTLKQSFTRVVNFCNQQDITLSQVVVRSERIDDLLRNYEEIQNQIDELTPEHLMGPEEEYRQQIEEAYYQVKAKHSELATSSATPQEQQSSVHDHQELTAALQLLTQHQTSMSSVLERFVANVRVDSTSTPTTSANSQQGELKLPRIQLPDFDGNVLKWTRFKDLFEALVHNKTNLAAVEKLEYLQSKLKGEALIVIKHLRPTNTNYTVAWDLLNNRYNNTEKVKNAHMELLFDQPAMKAASLGETKRLYNSVNEGFNAVKALDPTTSEWSTIVLFHMEKKLDASTAALWYREKAQGGRTFDSFLKFLEKRIFELDSIQASHQSATTQAQPRRNQSRTYTTTMHSCPVCSNQHRIFHCQDFKNMSVNQRRTFVQKHGLCFNCLQDNHRVNCCKSSSCKKCNQKHNTMLHISGVQYETGEGHTSSSSSVVKEQVSNNQQPATYISANTTQHKQRTFVILPTALVSVIDNSGIEHQCRALLDSGSQFTLITEECVQRLNLKKQYDKTVVFGLASSSGYRTRGKVQLKIKADNNIISTEALCLSNLTQVLPALEANSEQLSFFKNLNMADPIWSKPRSVDIILGADVFMNCCLSQNIAHPSGSPVALNTIFGWVLMGNVNAQHNNSIITNHATLNLDQQLQQFWETEEVPNTTHQLSAEEQQAEAIYASTVQRDVIGRYVVRLLIKNNSVDIGESKHNALRRLYAMERKFKSNAHIEAEYKKFMSEYISLGHMEPIEKPPGTSICYLPHHSVIKPTSTTTKLRVVFDASCKTTNGKSLNDNLLVGPKVQRDLFDMLVSFRMYAIGFTGDIEKMYRQVVMHPDDRPLQCILWRENDGEPVKAYQLNTVTYGTASASYLATRTLNQIAKENRETYPKTAEIIEQNFYVDDLMCSMPCARQASATIDELRTILSSSGLHVRKWSSNDESILSDIANEDRASLSYTELQCSTTVSALGLIWDTTSDCFQFSINSTYSSDQVTKRTVLANVARIYDPMGWIAPVVVGMKIFMQTLWLKGVAWDEQLPSDLISQWLKLHKNIANIGKIQIQRWVRYTPDSTIELHGFSDASERAYAAAVYVKVTCNNNIFTHLITAKTRVAPIKQISLPRLELCGAHLLAKLLHKVSQSLKMPNITKYGWTDSMIVLAWLSDHPCRWKTFVANRTTQIISIVPAQQWHHIKGEQNPADLATRGVDTENLICNTLWWKGPIELHQNAATIPHQVTINNKENLEERKTIVSNATTSEQTNFIYRYSSLTKLIRVAAFILRFIYNCKQKQTKRTGFLTSSEFLNAHDTIVKTDQHIYYERELQTITKGRALPESHHLAGLAPFIDQAGLLRVGGRISNASINFNQKHPLILNKDSILTQLIIRHYHHKHCHAGQRLLYYLIHLKYWIHSVAKAIKACINKCISCTRQRAKPYEQQMGQLPGHRLSPAPAFSNLAIDFAGPVQIRAWKGRGAKTYKCWVAVYVCLVTKAIHVDLVTELSTAAFMACFRRFVSRRGSPIHVYSDNGTNFVGANQQLKDLYAFINDVETQETIFNTLAEQQIQWHFSPPAGPHFGGLWEAEVKSVKYHLKRVLKDAHPTYEEMYTILCQIECCLNSRPLCLKFEGDLDPLTPAHFLILRPMLTLPDENYTSIRENRLTRWEYVQRLVQQFWRKWSLEYMNQLQQRPKWKMESKNLKVDDIVLIKDDNLAPSHWSLGKIKQLHPGKDGLVRVATVKTAKGEIKRPIVKLCPLFEDL